MKMKLKMKNRSHRYDIFFFFVTLFIVDYICTLSHPTHTSIYHGVL